MVSRLVALNPVQLADFAAGGGGGGECANKQKRGVREKGQRADGRRRETRQRGGHTAMMSG